MRPTDLLELGGARRTPLIQQSEAAECGLACLAMVAGHHRFETDMATLRRRFALSLKGTTLKTLMQVAGQIGFTSRPLRCEIENLETMTLPAILHWNLTHFVVLTKITRGLRGRRFHIHDPALGARVLREQEVSRHFTGVALELIKSEAFRPQRERTRLRITQLWSRISGLGASLRQVLLLSIVLQLVTLATPFYLQVAVDTAFPAFDTDLLTMLALGFGGLVLINMVTSWLRTLILVSLASSLSYQVIVNLYRHLLRLPLPWFEKRHVGDILSRFGSTKPITDLLSQGLIASAVDGVMSLATLALMFVYSPKLAGIAVAALLIVAAIRISFLHTMRNRNIDAVTTAARENSAFIETVRGISAIKAFGQEDNRQRLWQQQKAAAVNAEIKMGRLSAGFDSGRQFVIGIERIVFVYVAMRLAMAGDFSVGMIFAFQAYKQQFLDAALRLIEQAMNFRLLDVHLERIADIALSKPEEAAQALPHPAAETEVRGAIELRHVRFRYGAGEPEILGGINLKVEAGSSVALVGPSGGGKTTLLKIMMGVFQPTHGQVLVDGKPLANLGLGKWRQQIGSVAQDDQLFAGTLAENIAFFDPEISMDRVVEAARLACIHDEIEKMPLQYDTLVGDMGSVLSGGQKQRVLLARALYGRPRILFIDEGTAHLDPVLEAEVVRSLDGLGITRIVIAHRPQAIQTAERLVAVAGGTVRELSKTPAEPQRPGGGPTAAGAGPSIGAESKEVDQVVPA
jgi:ATP-binding cassette subfamily B protein RaxB